MSVLLLEKIQRHQFCRTFFAQWHGAQFVAHLEPTALVLLASAFKFVLTATISEATAMTTVRRRKRRTRRRKWKQVTLTGDHPQAGLMCVSHSLSWPQKVISKFHPERRFPKIPDAASSLGLLTSFFVCVSKLCRNVYSKLPPPVKIALKTHFLERTLEKRLLRRRSFAQ